MTRPGPFALCLVSGVLLCLAGLRPAHTQSTGLRRITNSAEEGININPSISGDGRIVAFESTEDVAGAGGSDHFRAIRANVAVDPATFFQIGGTRAVAPAISQDGVHIAFASKDDPLGANPDGNSEIFLFDGASLIQVTNSSPGDIANRVANGNFQPSISDDGRFIAFSSNRDLTGHNSDGNLEVFVYDSVASAFAQLTDSSGIVGFTDARISGNGASVAYIRDPGSTPGARRDLLRQARTGTGPALVLAVNVQSLLMSYGRAISDDGTRVVYSGETAADSSQVFLYDGRGGSAIRQITSLGVRVSEVPLHATISGDGTRLAFATRRTISGFSNSDNSIELYTYDVPTGQFARVTSAPAEADGFEGSTRATEVVSSLNDDGSIIAFNFPRALSGPVTAGFENRSEIYVTATAERPPFGTLAILNGASFGNEPSPIKAVAPDSIAVVRGNALASSTMQSQRLANGDFPTNVGGTSVTVNGRAAQIFFISPGQVNFLVPPQTEIGNADVVVTNSDNFTSRGTAPTLRAAPGVFTTSGDGTGEGMILTSDSLQEGPFDPSNDNLRLTIFLTGARNAIQTQVVIGGRTVDAESVIASPDMRGLDEVRVRVPSDLRGVGPVNLSVQSDGRDSNPVIVTFSGDPSRAVFINEVLADPPNGIAGDANRDGVRDGTQDEFVELLNGTVNESITVGGWTIRTRATSSTTETTRFTFAPGTTLPAREAIVVFGGGGAGVNPNDELFGCAQVFKIGSPAGLSLTNGGLTILVRDAAGNLITQFAYGGSTGLDGNNNQSLTRTPDITGNFAQHTSAPDSNGRRFSPGLKAGGAPFGICPRRLSSVTISPSSATVEVGETTQFTAQAFDQFGQSMNDVTINFASDSSTVAKVDSVTSNPGTGVATATVSGHNPGTAHLNASATDGGTTINSNQSTLTVTGPSLSINDVSLSEGNFGPTTFTFGVSLSQPAPAGGVSFNIATQDATATVAASDYVARNLVAQVIPAGQQTYTFDVTVNGDGDLEPFETFFVNITNISGASAGDPQGLGTIQDDDGPVLSVSDVTAEEGNTGTTIFSFTVTSTQPAPAPGITFDIATADGTAQDDNPASEDNDYVARTLTSQTIPAGQSSYTCQVTVNGDTTVEANENFTVNISNVSANATAGDAQGVGSIQNDDFALMVISQIYGGGNNSGATFKNDFVELFNRGNTTIDLAGWSVQQASATGASWSVTELCPSGSCLVAPGKYFLLKLAPANPTVGADLPAPDATGTSNLSAPSGKIALVNDSIELSGTGCLFGLSIVDFVGYGSSANCSENSTHAPAHSNTTADFRKSGGCVDTNDNAADFVTATPNPRNSNSPANDCSTGFRPDITINNVSISEGDSGPKTVDFTVALSAANNLQTVTVNFATADVTASSPSDYQSTSSMLTFNPGETSKPVTVTIVGDTTLESNETFFVNLSNPANAVILDGQGQGTITEDEVAPALSINDVSMEEGNSGTRIFQFTVSLSGPALSGGVTFDIATQDNSATVANGDYAANSLSSQTIPAGQQTYTFNVTVNGDGNIEPNETFFVNVTNISGAMGGDTQGIGTIQTDDSPVLSINDVSMTEGDTGTKIFTFTISSTMPAPAGGVTFNITTQDGTAQDDNPATEDNDYLANSTIGKTITGGTTSTTFNVTVNGDRLVEPVETFNVVISNASGGEATIGDGTGVGTIQNDDTAVVVISQVYPGGGLSGATFTNDFIELFNAGGTTVDFSVTPYSVQFLSTGGSTWARSNLTSGTLAPGRYFLVSGTGGSAGAALPTAEARGSINLTNTTPGKVALVSGSALLTGNCPGDDTLAPFNPANGTILDFVGYGGTAATANHCYEGSGPAAFTSGSATTADFRKLGGCQDTNDNVTDFLTAPPSPRNSNSPANDCSAADVSITKGDSPDPVVTASNVIYTITVTNNGPAMAQSVVVTDNLPGSVTFVSCASTGSGVCGGTGNDRTGTFSSLAAGATETVTLVATADGAGGTTITNTATVASTTTDSNTGNNSATATTDVTNPVPPALSIGDVAQVETDAGTTTFTFTVSLSSPAQAGGVSFTVNIADGTTNPATAGSDYVAIVNGSGSIAENDSSTTISVTVNGDTVFEPDETFFVNLTSVTGATVTDGQAVGTITNDDAQPTLAMADAIITEGNAGTSLVTFTVTLTGTSQSTVSVNYATADSSATVANSDYDSASGTLNFTSGDTSETFTVTIHGDLNAEGDEMFLVNLSGASGATISDNQALGIIFLDDPFAIVAVNTAYSEDFNILAQSGVSATTPPAWTRAESGSGANTTYTANNGSITSGDTYSYGTTSAADRALGGLRTGTLAPTIGAFYRNDTGSILNTLQINYTGEEWRLGNAGRTDRLDFQYSTDATSLTTGTWTDVNTLDLTTPNTTTTGAKDGNDIANRTAISNTITGLSIAAGATFWIRWTDLDATGSDDGLAVDDFSITAGVDTPALSLNDKTQVETNAGTTTFNFTVSLTSPAPPGGVSFTINTADGTTNPANAGSDYVAIVNGSGSIAQNDTSTTVSVIVNGDTDIEPDETFFVNLSAVSGATATDGQGLGTITNDDAAAASADLSVTKTDSADPVAVGNDITYTITVTNSGPDAADSAVLADTVPANTTFISISAPVGWSCPTVPAVGGTGAISCNNPSFGVGSAVITLVVRVGIAVADGTSISNTATISSGTVDSNTGNESATETTLAKTPLLVISQVYGAGNNSGAAYQNDFVQTFNRGTTTVNFAATNYSVQYASSAGTFNGASNFKVDLTTGTVAPGQYFLIKMAGGTTNGTAFAGDLTSTINMSASGGKVALVLGTTVATTTSGCPSVVTVVDFVGFGSANCAETSATAALSITKVAVRNSNGCTDTNNNASDFTVTTVSTSSPAPKNSGSSLSPCP